MTSLILFLFTLLAFLSSTCVAFAPSSIADVSIINAAKCSSLSSSLSMAPRYDEQTKRWSPTSPEEEASAGYGPIGSLIRFGPVPFVRRLADPDTYDQGVLKMLANENFESRDEAQGNMDAFLTNPNDYALQKLEEKRTGVKYDYAKANMGAADLALTAAWTGVLLSVVARVVYVSRMGVMTSVRRIIGEGYVNCMFISWFILFGDGGQLAGRELGRGNNVPALGLEV